MGHSDPREGKRGMRGIARAAVVLVDTQGYAYSEAAAILGIPPGTVASRLSSAHARLRTALGLEDACDPTAGEPVTRP